MNVAVPLSPGSQPVRVPGTGISVVPNGFRGTLQCQTAEKPNARQRNTRAVAERASSHIAEALAEAGLDGKYILDLEGQTPPDNSSRHAVRAGVEPPANELRLELEPAASDVLFAVYRDERGVLSIHLPEPRRAGRGAVRATTGKTFRIRLRPEPKKRPAKGERGTREVLQKIITLVAPVAARPLAGKLEFAAVKWWENKKRGFQGFHRGDPRTLLAEQPLRATAADLKRWAGQPTLLFIHGTTSSTREAFGALADFPAEAKALWKKYDGRVIAFNHHTMSKSVAENVVDFFAGLPNGKNFIFDAVAHSRGGLVARAIAHLPDAQVAKLAKTKGKWKRPATVQLRRTVFVGTPNNGTDIADPDNLPKALDWLANIADLFPASGTAIALGAIFSIAAYVGETGLTYIPGLADQAAYAERKMSPLLEVLNKGASTTGAFGVAAHFKPEGRLLAAALAFAIDRAFRGAANDLVVPAAGITNFGGTRFAAGQVKAFAPANKPPVHHTSYFAAPDTWRHILASLEMATTPISPPPQPRLRSSPPKPRSA